MKIKTKGDPDVLTTIRFVVKDTLFVLVGNSSYGLTPTLVVISRDFMDNHVINGSRYCSETF